MLLAFLLLLDRQVKLLVISLVIINIITTKQNDEQSNKGQVC